MASKEKLLIEIPLGVSIALWGIGLSLPGNYHIGTGGIGFGEVVFILSLLILLNDRFFLRKLINSFEKMKLFLLLAILFIIIFSFGNFIGMYVLESNLRSLFILFRQIFYLFILVPVFATLSTEYTVNRYFCFFLSGVLLSIGINFYWWSISGNYSTLPGQNPLGSQISSIFPFVMYQFFRKGNNTHFTRMLLFAVLLVLLASVFLTWSKGAWISVILTSVIMIVMLGFSTKGVKFKKNIFLFLLVLTVIVYSTFSLIYQIVSTEIYASAGSKSNEQRILATISGVLIGLNYPLGVGSDNYSLAVEKLNIDVLWIMPDPHNTYAHALTWAGIIGFPVFLSIYFYPLWLVILNRKILGRHQFLYVPMLVGIYFSANFSGEYLTQPFSWFIFALVIGHVMSVKNENLSKNN